MKITDLDGREITVVDLEAAIAKAREFTGYRHTDRGYAEYDRNRKRYWTDVLEKLEQLKREEECSS